MCDKEFLAFKDCVQVCRVTGLDGPLTVIAESRRKAVVILSACGNQPITGAMH